MTVQINVTTAYEDIILEAHVLTTICDIKKFLFQFHNKPKKPLTEHLLLYSGVYINNNYTLADYDIPNNAQLELVYGTLPQRKKDAN